MGPDLLVVGCEPSDGFVWQAQGLGPQYSPPFVPSAQKPQQSPVIASIPPKSTMQGLSYGFFF